MRCYNVHLIKDQLVPCNKCIACRARIRRQWVFRLKQESYDAKTVKFLTFTYETPPKSQNGLDTLHNPDMINFVKKLRKKVYQEHGTKFRYYNVGEYGGRFGRPHYHSIIFNLPENYINPKWNKKEEIWQYPELTSVWEHGYVDVADATPASMAYVAGYCMDKLTARQRSEFYHLDTGEIVKDDRSQERNMMSKGIGKGWLTPEIIKHFRKNCIPYITEPNGYRLPIPRYYRDKIFNTPELKSRYLDAIEKYRLESDFYPDYRAMREAINQRKRIQYKKHITKGYDTRNIKELTKKAARI